jgi:D-arabinose 1-dehydrogenase-like Zn-dependent alcohol dehydrogenase
MGLHVVAIDVEPAKLALARELGAKLAIDASTGDPAAVASRYRGSVLNERRLIFRIGELHNQIESLIDPKR